MGFVMFEQDRVCVIQCDGVRSLTFRRFSESVSSALSPFEDLFPAPWFPVEHLRDQPICSFAPPLHLEAACLLLFKTLLFFKSPLQTRALILGRRVSRKYQGLQVKFVLIGRSHPTKGRIPSKWDLFCRVFFFL